MKQRSKLRENMGLDELVHGRTRLIVFSGDTHKKKIKASLKRMAADHKRRERQRLKEMNARDANE